MSRPSVNIELSEEEAVRFWNLVAVSKDVDACWEWRARSGVYGNFLVRRGGEKLQYIPSRVAFTLSKGAIPKGLLVCHECDNPKCCNPKHLFLGTYQDNAQDRESKGRGADVTGENNPQSKLSWSAIEKIRKQVLSGKRGTQRRIAREHGLSEATISLIVSGKNWRNKKHVEADTLNPVGASGPDKVPNPECN